MSEAEPAETGERFRITERLPVTLHVAFWALIAAAAANVFLTFRNLIGFTAESYVANMHRVEAVEHESPLSDSAILGLFVAVLVLASLLAAGEVVLAILVRRGRNWARIVVTVVFVLEVLVLVLVHPAGSAFVISFFIGAAAVATIWFLWLPASNRYFRLVEEARKRHRPPPLAAAIPAHPPAWTRDPSGRHQFRYWDGARWTEYVGDNGAEAVDPL